MEQGKFTIGLSYLGGFLIASELGILEVIKAVIMRLGG